MSASSGGASFAVVPVAAGWRDSGRHVPIDTSAAASPSTAHATRGSPTVVPTTIRVEVQEALTQLVNDERAQLADHAQIARVVLDIRSVRDRKTEAFRQHTSQAPLMERTRAIFEKYGAEEFYTLLAASTPQPAAITTDLFAGL